MGVSDIFKAFLQVTIRCGFRTIGQPRTCGDWIFSGHTATMYLPVLAIAEYCPASLNRLLGVLTTLSALIGTSMVLLSHDHYTIDCLIAYFVVTRVFWNYHCLVQFKVASKGRSILKAPLQQVWWIKMFDYIEEKNCAIVSNNFVWEEEEDEMAKMKSV